MNISNITTLLIDWTNIFTNLGVLVIGLIGGAAAGFFISRALSKKQLKDNPPINEKQIRAMLLQMGQKPSEARIRQIMKAMEQSR